MKTDEQINPTPPAGSEPQVRSRELFSGMVQTLRWMAEISSVEKPCSEWKPVDWHAAGAAFAFKCAAHFIERQIEEMPENTALSQGGPATNENKREPEPPLAPANG